MADPLLLITVAPTGAETAKADCQQLPTTRCPVVRFPNRGGLAEFEKHQDLIDRIRFGILQRMVLVVMQVFRQRALKGMPSHYPDDWPVTPMVEHDHEETPAT